MSESIEKTIDIDKILKSKMGSKVKFVPRFLVSWLKKIIHEPGNQEARYEFHLASHLALQYLVYVYRFLD